MEICSEKKLLTNLILKRILFCGSSKTVEHLKTRVEIIFFFKFEGRDYLAPLFTPPFT